MELLSAGSFSTCGAVHMDAPINAVMLFSSARGCTQFSRSLFVLLTIWKRVLLVLQRRLSHIGVGGAHRPGAL